MLLLKPPQVNKINNKLVDLRLAILIYLGVLRMLFKVLKDLIDKSLNLNFNKDLCIRSHSPKSKCKACQKACPKNAISFDKSIPDFSADCDYCQVCAGACPQGAIKINEPSQEEILKKIIFNKDSLSCEKTEGDGLKISCLAGLDKDFIYALDVLGLGAYINIDTEKCRACENYLYGKCRLESLMKLDDVDSEEKIKLRNDLMDLYKDSNSKREFLNSFASYAKETSIDMIASAVFLDNIHHEKKIDHSFDRLIKGLAITSDSYHSLIPVFNENCKFCGACEKLCPSGAIKISKDNINVDEMKCTSCSLCKDICYFQAINMKDEKISMRTNN